MFGPIASFENFMFNAFNFTGRATRAEYWWVYFIRFVLFFACLIADVIAAGMAQTVSINPLAYFTPWAILLTIIPATSLLARRLHDTGRSSFWILVGLVPGIGPPWLTAILCAKSEEEDNKWGPMRSPSGLRPKQKTASGKTKSDPMMGYVTLLKASREPTPEEVAAQREQISEYYRTQVLGARQASA